MSTDNPERESQPSPTEEVLLKMGEAYNLLRRLSPKGSAPWREAVEIPEDRELAAAIGEFVIANAAALGDISTIERPPDLQAAAYAWLETRLRHKLQNAMYSEQVARAEAEITAMLKGKTITATSLQQGFGVSTGYGTLMTPNDRMIVTAQFYSVSPAHGTLWLGTHGQYYRVPLYDIEDPSKPASTIKVH